MSTTKTAFKVIAPFCAGIIYEKYKFNMSTVTIPSVGKNTTVTLKGRDVKIEGEAGFLNVELKPGEVYIHQAKMFE